jgi:hypothetical protein
MKNIKSPQKILFIADKWCAGNYKFGVSEWETNLWKSLKNTRLISVEVFHFDNYYLKHNKLGDQALINKINRLHPDIICLIIYKMPGSDFNVPKWETLTKIRNFFKIPIFVIWGDLEITEQVKISEALLPYVTLNIATASSAAVKRINNSKYVYMWVPKDSKVFNNPMKTRDIDVSYLGSSKGERFQYIDYLIQQNIPVFYGGGEREKHLSTQEYAGILQRSKITLGFSRSNYSHVINARPFEAMNCGAMVLEQENFETPKLFVPFVDYVPYAGKKDLLRKIRYYLEHDKEREAIARNGHNKATKVYSSKRFWQLAIKWVTKPSSLDSNGPFLLKSSNLRRLPLAKSFKLKFLDILCSNCLGFKAYKIIIKTSSTDYWKNLFVMFKNRIIICLTKRLSHKKYKKLLKIGRYILGIERWNKK